jgi:hypothetical protein
MPDDSVSRAIAWLQIVLGAIWLLFTGGCTLTALWNLVLPSTGPDQSVSSILPIVLVIGAIGSIPGAALVWAGVATLRRK